jgi:hypothetical protein
MRTPSTRTPRRIRKALDSPTREGKMTVAFVAGPVCRQTSAKHTGETRACPGVFIESEVFERCFAHQPWRR